MLKSVEAIIEKNGEVRLLETKFGGRCLIVDNASDLS